MKTTSNRTELDGVNWRAAVWAGIIAGVVDRVLLVSILLIQGFGVWSASRLTGAIVLGTDALEPRETFDLTILVVSLLLHFGLSIIYGLMIAALIHRFDWMRGLMIGAAVGLAIYLLNYYVIAPMAFPWIVELRGPVETLIHPVFGATAAAAYLWLRKRRHTTELAT